MFFTSANAFSGPPAPFRLYATPNSYTSTILRWKVNNHQRDYYTGFKVRWAKLRSDSWQEEEVTTLFYKLENLQPTYRYNISVAGFLIHDEEKLVSDPAVTMASSLVPGRLCAMCGKVVPILVCLFRPFPFCQRASSSSSHGGICLFCVFF